MSETTTRLLHCSVYRAIPTIAVSEHLFDDIGDEQAQIIAMKLEMDTKPGQVSLGSPIIHRPFDQADWYGLIGYPFDNIGESRLSTGRYGVWYGALEQMTTIAESMHYTVKQFLADRLDGKKPGRMDRRVYALDMDRMLVDMTKPKRAAEEFSDPNDWTHAQGIASRLRAKGATGILYNSARCAGLNVGLFGPDGLEKPRMAFDVRFIWEDDYVAAYRGDEEMIRVLT